MPTTPTPPSMRRSCGSCTVCCTVCPVEALGKPEFTRCQYLRIDGCRIYTERPDACREYRCSWLSGMFGDYDRPDMSGVLFEDSFLGTQEDPHGGLRIVVGMATGERQRKDWGPFANYAAPGTVIAIVGQEQDDHRVYGYPADVQRWLDFLSRTRAAGYDRTSEPGQPISIRTKDQ